MHVRKEEMELSLLMNDVIVYVKNPKEITNSWK
jgi:hypothetical protein